MHCTSSIPRSVRTYAMPIFLQVSLKMYVPTNIEAHQHSNIAVLTSSESISLASLYFSSLVPPGKWVFNELKYVASE